MNDHTNARIGQTARFHSTTETMTKRIAHVASVFVATVMLFGAIAGCESADKGNATASGEPITLRDVSADYEADFYYLALVGRYPIAPRWTLLGRLGLLYWETEETYNENGFISTDSDSGSSVMIGGGIEYDIGLEDRRFTGTG